MQSRIGARRARWPVVLVALALLVSLHLTPDAVARAQAPGWSAGPVAPGSGYAAVAGSLRVREVQRRLRRLGLRPGPLDGRFGPQTTAAVVAFQRRQGLVVDAVVGARTRAALADPRRFPPGWEAGAVRRWSGYGRPGGSRRVRDLQRRLRARRLDPGPLDGLFGPRTEAATRRLQARAGLPVTGIADPATLHALAPARRPATHPRPPATTPATPARPARPTSPKPQTTTPTTDDHGGASTVPVLVLLGALALAALYAGRAWLGVRRSRPRAEPPPTQPVTGDAGEPAVEQASGAPPPVEPAVAATPPPAAAPPRAGATGPPPGDWTRAIGYASTPHDGVAADRELGNQAEAIRRGCSAGGLQLVELVGDREPPDGRAAERQGLEYAVQRIIAGHAGCLIAADLGRLSRSAAELRHINDVLEARQIRLILTDLGLDTANPDARRAVHALAQMAEADREDHVRRLRIGHPRPHTSTRRMRT